LEDDLRPEYDLSAMQIVARGERRKKAGVISLRRDSPRPLFTTLGLIIHYQLSFCLDHQAGPL
jgi:hypothetical protein